MIHCTCLLRATYISSNIPASNLKIISTHRVRVSSLQGHRSLLFVVEYKSAHRFSVEYLRAGLHPMRLREEVVRQEIIPRDPGDHLNYNLDCFVGAVVTQTSEYLIDNGLQYSYIATGQVFVFLRVLEDDPTTGTTIWRRLRWM